MLAETFLGARIILGGGEEREEQAKEEKKEQGDLLEIVT